ncbi:MAG: hypothetical protein K2X82_09665 [Gemmataceae bacterium]|nr:hypothetical protein [Gemmataceae bacterium]
MRSARPSVRRAVLFGLTIASCLAVAADASACHRFRRRSAQPCPPSCPPRPQCPPTPCPPGSPNDNQVPPPNPNDPPKPKDPIERTLPKISDVPPEVPAIVRPDFLKDKK